MLPCSARSAACTKSCTLLATLEKIPDANTFATHSARCAGSIKCTTCVSAASVDAPSSQSACVLYMPSASLTRVICAPYSLDAAASSLLALHSEAVRNCACVRSAKSSALRSRFRLLVSGSIPKRFCFSSLDANCACSRTPVTVFCTAKPWISESDVYMKLPSCVFCSDVMKPATNAAQPSTLVSASARCARTDAGSSMGTPAAATECVRNLTITSHSFSVWLSASAAFVFSISACHCVMSTKVPRVFSLLGAVMLYSEPIDNVCASISCTPFVVMYATTVSRRYSWHACSACATSAIGMCCAEIRST